MADSSLVTYGHTFKSEKDLQAYKKYMSEKRKRSLARKVEKSPREREDAKIRAHFAKEAKRFNI